MGRKQIAAVHDDSAIAVRTLSSDRKTLTVKPGPNRVLVVERRQPARFFTYDTGYKERLFVEFDRTVDLSRDAVTIDSWVCTGFVQASMAVVYLSMQASGVVTLQRHEKKPLFRRPRTEWHGSARMIFIEPLIDLIAVGECAVDWTF